MKKLLITLALLIFMGNIAYGQTTVNLSVTDTPDNQTWNNGTWSVQLQPAPNNLDQTKSFKLLLGGGNLSSQSGSLSNSGTATLSLPANSNIGPSSTIWYFTVCPNASANCFSQSVVITTGSPQTITLTPLSIRINLAVATSPVYTYSDTEIQNAVPGSTYFNVGSLQVRVCSVTLAGSCTTWINGTGGTTTPGGSPIQTQVNNGGVFGGTTCESFGNITLGPETIDCDWHSKGPNPYADITRFGARPISGAIPQTTASCTSGLTTITLVAASTFQNGDGVTLFNCGVSSTASAPPAPTVAPGQSQVIAVPDALMASDTSGASTYKYALVTRDSSGGLSAASSSTTITNGASTIGPITLNISSASLSNNTLTVVTTTNHGLVVNTLVHLFTTGTLLDGWYNVASITNNTTFVCNAVPLLLTLSATAGTVTYFKGNQISFTNPTGGFQTYICAQRPADSSLHVIGATWPFSSTTPSSVTFTDWGSTVTTKPTLPLYVTDAICTGSGQHDPLTTTIVSGAGTTSLVLASSASNTVSGQTILYDDGSAFAAAASSALTNQARLYIPASSGSFNINSRQSLRGIGVIQAGNINLGETLDIGQGNNGTGNQWVGAGAIQSDSANFTGRPRITGNGAWPVLYSPNTFTSSSIEHVFVTSPSANGGQGNGNQGLIFLLNGGAFSIKDCAMSTGGPSDYSGIAIALAGGFQAIFEAVTINGGPGVNLVDTTWSPQIYVSDQTDVGGFGQIRIRNLNLQPRGMFDFNFGGGASGGGAEIADIIYVQGGLVPTLTVYNPLGTPVLRNIVQDSSALPHFVRLPTGIISGNSLRLTGCVSGSGLPVQGSALTSLVTDCVNPIVAPTINLTNDSVRGSALDGVLATVNAKQYANLYAGAAIVSNFDYPIFIDGVPTAAPSAVIAGGGSVPVGAHTYQIAPYWQNGGTGRISPSTTATTTLGNQTVNLSWSVTAGNCKGYIIYRDGLRLTTGVPSVTGCATVSFSDTLAAATGGSQDNGVVSGGPTMLMPGTQGIASGGPIIIATSTFTNLGAVPVAGVFKYCVDCTTAATCAGSGSGHMAVSNGTSWTCQ